MEKELVEKEQIEQLKLKRLEEKYGDIISSKELIDKTNELDKVLVSVHEQLKQFDKDLDSYKTKEQKKIREF